jgi:hypothetical protein
MRINEEENIQIWFDKPRRFSSRLTLELILLLGHRAGNQIVLVNNKIVGLIVHKHDWQDIEKKLRSDKSVE